MLNQKPSVLPAVEVIAPGGSYNPDFFSHQVTLLLHVHLLVQNLKMKIKIFIKDDCFWNLNLQHCVNWWLKLQWLAFSVWNQALLQDAHNVEVRKQKQDDKIERQLAVKKEDKATEVNIIRTAFIICCFYSWCRFNFWVICVYFQETVLREQVEGLVEEENDEEGGAPNEDDDDAAVAAITVGEKKTEKQRKRERAEKMKVLARLLKHA